MHLLHLTLLHCVVTLFSGAPALEYSPSSPAGSLESAPANPTTTKDAKPEIPNIVFQSKDGGQTWQDISRLPENELPEVLFAEESGAYLPIKKWLPVYANFEAQSVRSIFETSKGTVFIGSDDGLYKSDDKGASWKQVLDEGWVMDLVESEGVLMGTGQKGIMRSTDNGEHWEWVISEGGVGIALEPIDGGFAAISCNSTTITRRIRISLDNGKTWEAADAGLQPSLFISSIKQMGKYLVCGHPDGIFRSSDMGKTWHLVQASVDKRVFEVYVSGNVLYAVAKDPGC